MPVTFDNNDQQDERYNTTATATITTITTIITTITITTATITTIITTATTIIIITYTTTCTTIRLEHYRPCWPNPDNWYGTSKEDSETDLTYNLQLYNHHRDVRGRTYSNQDDNNDDDDDNYYSLDNYNYGNVNDVYIEYNYENSIKSIRYYHHYCYYHYYYHHYYYHHHHHHHYHQIPKLLHVSSNDNGHKKSRYSYQ